MARQAKHRIRIGRGTRYTRKPEQIIRPGHGNVIVAAHSGRQRVHRPPPAPFSGSTDLLHPLLPDAPKTPIRVSVVLGTYNRLALLRKCIDSIVRACKRLPYEIVVSDGGSTDGSRDFLRSHPNVVLLEGDLSGAVPAFNAAARRATGQFIVCLNDDAELTDSAIDSALKYFANPKVGQVAMRFYEGGKWKIESVFDRPYANFAVTRTSVVRAVERITGGMWSPCYKTYGGDTELSCWVSRLGYQVVAASDAKVIHHEHQDRLRSGNVNTDRQRRQFWQRWTKEATAFRGPLPGVSPPEVARLRKIEAGETVHERWPRIAASDPTPGQPPPSRGPKRERVLHWQLWTPDDPQTSMVAGLRTLGSSGHLVVPWTQHGVSERSEAFLAAMRSLRPTVAFLQCQDPTAIPIEALRAARTDPARDPSLAICVWSGDVGPTKGPWSGMADEWQYKIAREVDLMLFTGTGQVKLHRQRGMANAAYLQIGYDVDRYHTGPTEHYGTQHDLVFMGQNYGRGFDNVPTSEAQLRRDAVAALRTLPRFTAYGSGFGPPIAQAQSGDVYRRSHMALSISLCSSLGRYCSDRMLRAMACGCATLVKRFEDMEGMGLVDGVNCIAWDTVPELVDKARHWLEPSRRDDLRLVGDSGAALMRKRHTWNARMHELSALLSTIRHQA